MDEQIPRINSVFVSLAFAYPRPDPRIRHHLTVMCTDPMRQEIYYLQFFAYLFRRLNEELSSMGIPKQKTYADLAVRWRSHLDDHKNDIYADVVDALKDRRAKVSHSRDNVSDSQ